jgi:Concanavalin A-like lectin/glucanases superfamily
MKRRKIMKSKLSLMIIILIVTALLMPAVGLSRADDKFMKATGLPKKNKALYLGWGGYVDTYLRLSSFFTADHTVMAWFMPQYPHAFSGPLFTVNNGTNDYWVGQNDYRLGDGGPRPGDNGETVFEKGKPVFSIQVGGIWRHYLIDQLIAGKWAHIAVVRKNNTFELYVNGIHQFPVTKVNKKAHSWEVETEITVNGNSVLPVGNLRLGRFDPDRSKNDQAYGLLDDVAVFNKALSVAELNEIRQKKRLSSTQDGLLAGWCFDQPEPDDLQLPEKLNTWWKDLPRTYRVEVTTDRNSEKDKNLFDNPIIIGETLKTLLLPFRGGDVWEVVQGYDAPGGSHNGYAAFCYDFKRVETKDGEKLQQPEGTAYTPVYAVAPAQANSYSDYPNAKESQKVSLKLGENEYMSYLHLATGSLNEKFTGGNFDANKQIFMIPSAQAKTIQQDEPIAQVFDWGDNSHLHFNLSNGNVTTIPAAFSDYEVSTDGGKTWTKVFRGHPKAGQYIKRAGNPAPPKPLNLQCLTSNASVKGKIINGEQKFEHRAFVSVTAGASQVPVGTVIKYSVNGYPPKSYKVSGDFIGIPPFAKQGLGWYTILLDDKEPWPDGCSASYTNK